jgi:hypothetical protein
LDGSRGDDAHGLRGLLHRAPPRGGVIARLAFIAVLLVAGTVLFLHWALASVTCGWDTSYCAESREKDTAYRGQLATDDGRVLADTPFTVRFESHGEAPVGGFRSDAEGQVCVLWANEAISPTAYVNDELVARLEVPAPEEEDRFGPATDCQTSDASITWNRTEDLRETPQFLSAFIPGLLAIVVLLVGVFRPTRTLFAVGSLLTGATFAAFAVLWFA